jgi:hypothetical protein
MPIKFEALSKAKQETILSVLEERKKGRKTEHFRKMKKVLDAAFGPENNQIVQPYTTESICERINSGYSQLADGDFKRHLISIINSYLLYRVEIRFPEFIIRNSHGSSHTIREMYIQLQFREDGRLAGSFTGLRAAMTMQEYRGLYQHSHISGFSARRWTYQ